MSKNYITLLLGEKERGLKFNVGTLNFMQSEFDIDPLTFKAETTDWKNLLPYAEKIIYVAMLSNCRSKKEQPDFKLADITLWVEELNAADLTQVINMWNGQFLFSQKEPSANGEVGKDTQPVLS
jgi:hypothetical protein